MKRWLNWLGVLMIIGDFVWAVFFVPELTISVVIAVFMLALLGTTFVALD